MKNTVLLSLLTLFGSVALSCVLLTGCGLLNGAAGASGAPYAQTREAEQKAEAADRAVWEWLGYALFGVTLGDNVRQRRKAKRT